MFSDSIRMFKCPIDNNTNNPARNNTENNNENILFHWLIINQTCIYSETGLKRPPKNRQSSFSHVVAESRSKVLQNAPLGAFCNTFDLHKAIIGLENPVLVFLRGVA